MATNIGLNIVEVDGSGAPAIVGAAASVGAFNVITQRGVPNRPVRIDSFPKFVERFGGFFDGGLGAYLVKGFFDNGGQTAYVNRVATADPVTGAAPAAVTLKDGAAVNTLTLDAGYRGDADPGSWGNSLWVKVTPTSTPQTRLAETAPAHIEGTALTEPVNMGALPSLSVRIDGEPLPTVIAFQASDFPSGAATATRAQIRDAVNRRTTKLIASINTDKLVLTSTGSVAKLNKDWSSLQVTAANAALGFAAMGSATSGTPATPAPTGATLDRVDDFHVGDAVRVSDGTNTALTKIAAINPTARTVSFVPNVTGIAGWALLAIRVGRVEFDLTVTAGGTETGNVVETWTGLSMESDVAGYAPRILNDRQRGSRYLTATDAGSASPVGADVPAATALVRLDGGRDGTPTANDFIGDQAQRTGFFAFDAFDVTLLACERTDPGIVTAALAYCANRGDCMLIGAVPESSVEAGTALAYGQAFQARKVYGALYGPWILVQDPIGTGAAPLKTIPPVGHVMGVYARIETARGVWKAPAGDEASLLGVLDVEHRLSDGEHTDLVRNGSINGIRAVPRAGIIVDASRTLSTDTRWLYVNVRLLFNYVKSSLKQGLRWVRQEPNKDTLWNAVKFTSVTPFLAGLWRQGAFGTGQPAEVFTVICDATNNPPDEVDKGNLKVEVYFFPAKPAETIVIIVGQQPSGAKVSEA
jgi:phage tail sheath protein FI